jgi:hypothetical protein
MRIPELNALEICTVILQDLPANLSKKQVALAFFRALAKHEPDLLPLANDFLLSCGVTLPDLLTENELIQITC